MNMNAHLSRQGFMEFPLHILDQIEQAGHEDTHIFKHACTSMSRTKNI